MRAGLDCLLPPSPAKSLLAGCFKRQGFPSSCVQPKVRCEVLLMLLKWRHSHKQPLGGRKQIPQVFGGGWCQVGGHWSDGCCCFYWQFWRLKALEGRSRFEAGFWVSVYCRSYGWVDDDDDEPSRAVNIRFLLSILYTERRPNNYGMPPKSPYSFKLAQWHCGSIFSADRELCSFWTVFWPFPLSTDILALKISLEGCSTVDYQKLAVEAGVVAASLERLHHYSPYL